MMIVIGGAQDRLVLWVCRHPALEHNVAVVFEEGLQWVPKEPGWVNLALGRDPVGERRGQ
jgi:hypothetical protein